MAVQKERGPAYPSATHHRLAAKPPSLSCIALCPEVSTQNKAVKNMPVIPLRFALTGEKLNLNYTTYNLPKIVRPEEEKAHIHPVLGTPQMCSLPQDLESKIKGFRSR